MTTLAFRDGVLAADRLCSGNSAIYGFKTKIVKRHGFIAGATGSTPLCRRFTDWFMDGMAGLPTMRNGDCDATGVLIIAPKRWITFTPDGHEFYEREFMAWGSGCEFAIGAMAMGATAEQAVEVASRFCLHTGGPVDTLRFGS